LNVIFSNGYAYSIVDVPVGIRTGKTNDGLTEIIAQENEIFKISSGDIKIDLKYYLPKKPGNSMVLKTFKFKTKNVNYIDPEVLPGYWIDVGYILDQNYISKSGPYYLVN